MSTFSDVAAIQWRDEDIAKLRAELKQAKQHTEILERHLVGIVNNWYEFGATGGIDERMNYAHTYLVKRGLMPGQITFQDAVRNDSTMTPEQKARWLDA